jgi:hypothetical protein
MAATDPVRARARLCLCCLGLAFLASGVHSQNDPRPALKSSATAPQGESDDPHEEMRRLMGRVERRLIEIDKLLSKAGAGESGTQAVADGAVDRDKGTSALVRRSQEESRSAVRDIDRILELANHPHPPGAA